MRVVRSVAAWVGVGLLLCCWTVACGPAAPPAATPTASDPFAVVRATAEAAYASGKAHLDRGEYLQACVDLDMAKTNDPDNRAEIDEALSQALAHCLTPVAEATPAPARPLPTLALPTLPPAAGAVTPTQASASGPPPTAAAAQPTALGTGSAAAGAQTTPVGTPTGAAGAQATPVGTPAGTAGAQATPVGTPAGTAGAQATPVGTPAGTAAAQATPVGTSAGGAGAQPTPGGATSAAATAQATAKPDSVATPAGTSNFVTWRDPQGRFSIDAPADWSPAPQPQSLFGTSVVEFLDASGRAEVDVAVDTSARVVSPELYAASMELAMQQQIPGYASEQIQPGTTAGIPSVRRLFTFTEREASGQDHQARGFQVTLVKGSTPYIVSGSSPAEEFQRFSPTFDRMVESFRFS